MIINHNSFSSAPFYICIMVQFLMTWWCALVWTGVSFDKLIQFTDINYLPNSKLHTFLILCPHNLLIKHYWKSELKTDFSLIFITAVSECFTNITTFIFKISLWDERLLLYLLYANRRTVRLRSKVLTNLGTWKKTHGSSFSQYLIHSLSYMFKAKLVMVQLLNILQVKPQGFTQKTRNT